MKNYVIIYSRVILCSGSTNLICTRKELTKKGIGLCFADRQTDRQTGYPSRDKPWLKYFSPEAVSVSLPKCSAYDYLWESNKEHLNENALCYFGRTITYRTLFDNIQKVAASFFAMGIKSGDRVALCAVTTPETIYTFYALNYLGAIANIIDPRTNYERIKTYIMESDTKCFVAIEKCIPIAIKLREDGFAGRIISFAPSDSLPFIMRIAYRIKNKAQSSSAYIIPWKDFIQSGADYSKPVKAEYVMKRDAAIVYTGGTTGSPKGAVLSNDTFNTIALQYKYLGVNYSRGENFLNIMPPFIAYGIVCGIHMSLVMGLTNVIIPLLDIDELDSLVIKYKPVLMLGVPMHYEILAKSPKFQGLDLSFLQIPGCGGDGMNVKTEKYLNDFLRTHNCHSMITKGYGMTEVGSAAVTCFGTTNKIGSVGIPHCKTTVSVFKPQTDEELPYNTSGEICISTEAIMNGYLNRPNETNKVIRTHSDGTVWVHTGDIGYMDEDGFIFIKGRIKRMIIRPDGHNVFPLAIENIIMEHEAVENCAVVGQKDVTVENGEMPIAFIVLKPEYKNNTGIINDVKSLCDIKLPPRDTAKTFLEIEKLPMTSVGKVDYILLEKMTEDLD